MSDLYVCMHKHARLRGSGDMLPQKIFLNYMLSILVQKQSHSSYMARGELHSILA